MPNPRGLLPSIAAIVLTSALWSQNCPLVNSLTWAPSEVVGDGTRTATATISWNLNGFQGKFWALDIGNFPPSYHCDAPSFSGGVANACFLDNGPNSTTVTAVFGIFDPTQPFNLQTAAIADSCGGGAFGNILVDPPGTTNTAPSPTDPNPSPGDPSQPNCPDCQTDPQAGGPINLANGNTWIKQNDYRIPGFRGGLELTRTWNSGWQGSLGPRSTRHYHCAHHAKGGWPTRNCGCPTLTGFGRVGKIILHCAPKTRGLSILGRRCQGRGLAPTLHPLAAVR